MSAGDLLEHFRQTSALYGSNAAYIEGLYESYLDDPEAVPETWRHHFAKLPNTQPDIAHGPVVARFAALAQQSHGRLAKLQGFTEASVKKQASVSRLINQYRSSGHLIANNNPLAHEESPLPPEFAPASYGLTELDMDTVFDPGKLDGADKMSLRAILSALKRIYCGHLAVEYMHITDADIRSWLKNHLESGKTLYQPTPEDKHIILEQLIAAEAIENYLHRTFVGQKRFSLEGGETLIPMLDQLIQRAAANKTKEIVIGMAHRGRLNVLVNILGKNPAQLFEEFKGGSHTLPGMSSGDVKYHMGFSSDLETGADPVHVTLAFNPSHLEIINPVVAGSVRARQDRHGANSINTVLPVLIHGDAAFAGQGVVMETLNMSATRGFSIGGTVHIVINNQIGFTTSNPKDARSTRYCTDVASLVQAPVFHVNGDEPEAAFSAIRMALDFRMRFNRDVVIDLICYRRLGHNEADEPSATQPMMYQTIRNHPTTRQLYAQRLVQQGVVDAQQDKALEADYIKKLEAGQVVSRPLLDEKVYSYSALWTPFINQKWTVACKTALSLEQIRNLSEKLQQLPPSFELHPRVAKIMESRRKMAAGAQELDWGYAENLAYASLLVEGFPVRLTGQDVGRGTFFHRHAVLHNQLDESTFLPLNQLTETQARCQIYDSLLSEAGVLGFEYGYSTTAPNALVIWEAQFGDFVNGAQVVIDQFISSGESKWGRLSGLVMLLPHGYEGQGPEHSSARLERFLQLCAEHNLQVCVPSTPAQIFHLLRRQVIRGYRKPLVVMSPKSLLRHKLAVSSLEDLSRGKFQLVIGELDELDADAIQRLVLCAGKVYYDLLEARREQALKHVAIIRVEQLYPFPQAALARQLAHYRNLQDVVWCQEEPQNQGAWYQLRHYLTDTLSDGLALHYAGRPPSASPAVGNFKKHLEQQHAVVNSALTGADD
ncbi:MAG: 2-oxoglutarate dehydrogenase E1 component [Methylococcales bacterium]|nr:2-oxoglutarate dehydrogenase E1 component [Methylococcales bacterium]